MGIIASEAKMCNWKQLLHFSMQNIMTGRGKVVISSLEEIGLHLSLKRPSLKVFRCAPRDMSIEATMSNDFGFVDKL